MSFIRKNAPPASAEALRTAAEDSRKRIPELTAERDEINAAWPELAVDPTARREAEDRLAFVEAEISRERRTVALIEEAIPAAEKREEVAAFEADKAEQERKTAKLSRTLESRYTAAAEALSTVLRDMQDDERAWDRLNDRARDLALAGAPYVEQRLRKQFRPESVHLMKHWSLYRRAYVADWQGRELFRGAAHEYPEG